MATNPFAEILTRLNSYQDGRQEIDAALSATFVGAGFSTFGRELKAQIAEDQNIITKPINFNKPSFQSIETIQDFKSLLSVSATVSGVGLTYSASASLDLFKESEFNSYDYFVVVRREIRSESDVWKGGTLTGAAAADATSLTATEFFQRYGDCFVREVVYGGNFVGVLHVSTQDQSQKEVLKASFSASAGAVDVKASVESMTSSMSRFGQVTLSYVSTGGDLRAATDTAEFLGAYSDFGTAVAATKAAVAFSTQPLILLSGWPAGVKPPSFYDMNTRFNRLTNMAQAVESTVFDVNYIVDHPNQFDFSEVTIDQVKSYAPQLQTAVGEIHDKLDRYMVDPFEDIGEATGLPDMKLPDRNPIHVPNLKTTVVSFSVAGIREGDSALIAGMKGYPIAALAVQVVDPQGLDLQINYTAHFWYEPLYGHNEEVYSAGNGGQAGSWTLRGELGLISVSLAGNDGYLFDIHYECRALNDTLHQESNGGLLETQRQYPFDGLRVWLTAK